MIFGVGCDILLISRIVGLLEKSGRERVFTPHELEYIYSRGRGALQSAAGIFAAKEALLKSLGLGVLSVKMADIEIRHEPSGQPVVFLKDTLLKQAPDNMKIHLSISHDGEYAVAYVIAEVGV